MQGSRARSDDRSNGVTQLRGSRVPAHIRGTRCVRVGGPARGHRAEEVGHDVGGRWIAADFTSRGVPGQYRQHDRAEARVSGRRRIVGSNDTGDVEPQIMYSNLFGNSLGDWTGPVAEQEGATSPERRGFLKSAALAGTGAPEGDRSQGITPERRRWVVGCWSLMAAPRRVVIVLLLVAAWYTTVHFSSRMA